MIKFEDTSVASTDYRVVACAVSETRARLPNDSLHFGEPLLQCRLDCRVVRRLRIVIQVEEATGKTRVAAGRARLVGVSVGTQRKGQLQLCRCTPHVLGV